MGVCIPHVVPFDGESSDSAVSATPIGSLGHVLGHGLPHLILQVRQLVPFCLQLKPLVIWHLKEEQNERFENIPFQSY